MPLGDWQFWVVTVVGIGAFIRLVLLFVPKKRKPRTQLTIGQTGQG